MRKTLLITGSTDGIGLEAARLLVAQGHHVLLHGRSPGKLETAVQELSALPGGGSVGSYRADLSRLEEVEKLARDVAKDHSQLDVLINNAGVYNTPDPVTPEGFDLRFVVNTLAPYLLTRRLLPRLGPTGRVINLSSAAQAPVDPRALAGEVRLSDGAAYAQSKLALTMWSRSLALELGDGGPTVVAVNPGSLLATKMVRQAFGIPGGDVQKGAEILRRAALDEDFGQASGQYFDNDSGRFASPHHDALDPRKVGEIVGVVERVLGERLHELGAPPIA